MTNPANMDQFFDELPEKLSLDRWTYSYVKTGAWESITTWRMCPYCTALVRSPHAHITHSPSCLRALADAHGDYLATHPPKENQ